MTFTIPKTTPLNAVLPFYATGAMAFVVLCLLMVVSSESLTTHYFNPHLLSIVHLTALGWGSMIIFGAAYQLLPVVAEKELYNEDLATFSWYALCAGTMLLVYSFWDFTTGWVMIAGGSFVCLAAVFYLVNVVKTFDKSKQKGTLKWFVLSSAFWLCFTVVVGLLLAINLAYPFFRINHMEILKLHAHIGLAGWFLQLITGVSAKLVPMFLVSQSNKTRLLNAAFFLQNAGLLLFLADGYFIGFNKFRVIFYGVITSIGILCWFYFLFDSMTKRIKRKIDVQMKQTFLSFVCLFLAMSILPIIVMKDHNHLILLYGLLLFMGWITGIILGKTFKTLPFIIWNEHYKNLTGKVKVPLPKDLYINSLVNAQFVLYLVALVGLLIGVGFQHLLTIRISSILWLMLSLVFFLNVMLVLFHKTKIQHAV